MELNMDRITKQYGAKIAVDRISLTLKPGCWEPTERARPP